MKKFEYKEVVLKYRGSYPESGKTEMLKELNKYGAEGWELKFRERQETPGATIYKLTLMREIKST